MVEVKPRTPAIASAKKIRETSLDEDLQRKINSKADFEKAELTYRKKSVAITEDDLTTSLRMKIQTGGGAGGGLGSGVYYDDTDLRTRVGTLESDKVNSSEMVKFYKKTDIVSEASLDPAYKNRIKTQLDTHSSEILSLKNNKVSASALNDYRKKSDKITEVDLSQTLYNRILVGGVDSGSGENTSALKLMIDNLSITKADKTDLALLRKISDPIKISDVDQELSSALSTAAATSATLKNKAEKNEVALCRKLSVPIGMGDLDATLSSKLTLALNAATDIEAFVVEFSRNMRNDIYNEIVSVYGQQSTLHYPFQVELTQVHPGNGGRFDVFQALSLLYTSYRRNDVPIAEDQIALAYRNKVTSAISSNTTLINSLNTAITELRNNNTALTARVAELEKAIRG